MYRRAVRVTSAFLLITCIAAACSSGEQADESAADTPVATESAAESPAAAPSGSETATSAEASMTVADIDRWQKGMVAELAAVREAGRQFKAARSSNDSLSAMMETQETATRAAGARAVGVDENRYGIIRSTMSSVVRYMAPLEVEMDVKQMPASIQTSMKQDRDQQLARISEPFPPAVIEALRPRAAELRKQELALVQERLRAAGMIP